MKEHKKLICLVCALCVCFAFVSCKKDDTESSVVNNDKEISQKYDDILKETQLDSPIDSGASVIGKDFTVNDFTFTSADGTIAFSLDKNSFVKLLPGGTFFNYVDSDGEATKYDGIYKTAKGLSVLSQPSEFISKYAIPDKSAIYKVTGDDLYYNPTGGRFSGKLTALFASEDSLTYKPLDGNAVQRFISVWDLKSNGTYIKPSEITDIFPSYASIAVLNVTADDAGAVSEISVYRFDK